jgi:hypothetical protein
LNEGRYVALELRICGQSALVHTQPLLAVDADLVVLGPFAPGARAASLFLGGMILPLRLLARLDLRTSLLAFETVDFISQLAHLLVQRLVLCLHLFHQVQQGHDRRAGAFQILDCFGIESGQHFAFSFPVGSFVCTRYYPRTCRQDLHLRSVGIALVTHYHRLLRRYKFVQFQDGSAVGIVDSISAGYRFLVQRPQLLLLPLLIDAFLWLAPRLSIEPLLSQMADFYREFSAGIADAGAEFSGLADQTTQLLTVIGESSNLMELVVSRTLYHMPSLLASIPGIKSGHSSVQIDSVGTAGMLALLLGLLGIMIGVIYMNMLARAVPLGEGQKSPAPGQFTDLVIRQWLRTIGFVLGVCLLLVIIYVPATMIA